MKKVDKKQNSMQVNKKMIHKWLEEKQWFGQRAIKLQSNCF